MVVYEWLAVIKGSWCLRGSWEAGVLLWTTQAPLTALAVNLEPWEDKPLTEVGSSRELLFSHLCLNISVSSEEEYLQTEVSTYPQDWVGNTTADSDNGSGDDLRTDVSTYLRDLGDVLVAHQPTWECPQLQSFILQLAASKLTLKASHMKSSNWLPSWKNGGDMFEIRYPLFY